MLLLNDFLNIGGHYCKLQRCFPLYRRAVEKVINLCCLYFSGLNSIEVTPSVFKSIVYGGKREGRKCVAPGSLEQVYCMWCMWLHRQFKGSLLNLINNFITI